MVRDRDPMITDPSGSGFPNGRALPDVCGLAHENLDPARLLCRMDRPAPGPGRPLIRVMCQAKPDVVFACEQLESTSISREADGSRERADGRRPDPCRSRPDRAWHFSAAARGCPPRDGPPSRQNPGPRSGGSSRPSASVRSPSAGTSPAASSWRATITGSPGGRTGTRRIPRKGRSGCVIRGPP